VAELGGAPRRGIPLGPMSVIASCAASQARGVPVVVRGHKGCLRPSSGRRKWPCWRDPSIQGCQQGHFLQPPL